MQELFREQCKAAKAVNFKMQTLAMQPRKTPSQGGTGQGVCILTVRIQDCKLLPLYQSPSSRCRSCISHGHCF